MRWSPDWEVRDRRGDPKRAVLVTPQTAIRQQLREPERTWQHLQLGHLMGRKHIGGVDDFKRVFGPIGADGNWIGRCWGKAIRPRKRADAFGRDLVAPATKREFLGGRAMLLPGAARRELPRARPAIADDVIRRAVEIGLCLAICDQAINGGVSDGPAKTGMAVDEMDLRCV